MEYNKETLKILVVDDCEIDLDIMESILNQLGFKNIIKSGSAKEGIRLVEEHQPDIVFSDIMMPGLDGGDFRRILRENPVTKDVPVIFVSSIITREDEMQDDGQLVSKDLIVAKPLSKDRVAKVIDLTLKKTSEG